MLVTMKSILDVANRDNYGVMAVNSINMEMARAVIEAAEEMHSPIIVQVGMTQMKRLAHPDEMVPIFKELADRVNVPVALNLDHGPSLDAVNTALHYGFTNVMIDASSLPYEENVKLSRIVTDIAHACGASVEAEIGHVGQAADGDGKTDDMYTNVEQAVDFVQKTGVDALAVAIGTAHGKYPEGYVPVLDFNRLAELKAALKMPLVLHGGSGSGEENLRKAVAGGINKINVATDAQACAANAIKKAWKENPNLTYLDVEEIAEAAVKQFVKDYVVVIGSAGRYAYNAVGNNSKE